jgi:hypothetical protein
MAIGYVSHIKCLASKVGAPKLEIYQKCYNLIGKRKCCICSGTGSRTRVSSVPRKEEKVLIFLYLLLNIILYINYDTI